MTEEQRKECYKMFYMVKGHIGCTDWQDKDLESMRDSYFKRLWYNEEAYIYAQGFEEAYSIHVRD